MPLVVDYVNYITEVTYQVRAEIFLENKSFPLQIQETLDPSASLSIVKLFDRSKSNISYRIFSTTRFKREDEYISREPPIRTELSLGELEKIAAGKGPKIPVKKYPVYANASSRAVDIGD